MAVLPIESGVLHGSGVGVPTSKLPFWNGAAKADPVKPIIRIVAADQKRFIARSFDTELRLAPHRRDIVGG
jgi:hypothetical protein